jgi:endonuclease YncB( thermonuclease family)
VAKIVRLRPVRRRQWTSLRDYPSSKRAPKRRRSWRLFVPLWAGAALVGTAYGAGWLNGVPQSSTAAASGIKWNAAQAVPTRQLSPDELAWERRGREPVALADAADAAPPAEIIRGTRHTSPSIDSGVRGIQVIRGTGRSEPREERAVAGQRIYAFDGDTFVMGGRRIRIANIDAPELHPPRCAEEQRLGMAAKEKLQQLLGSGNVTISGSAHDRYGRDLRYVEVNGQDVGEAMLSAGLARSYHGEKRQGWC